MGRPLPLAPPAKAQADASSTVHVLSGLFGKSERAGTDRPLPQTGSCHLRDTHPPGIAQSGPGE